eukprot:1181538-Prorocentrum_minimum.AAC.4
MSDAPGLSPKMFVVPAMMLSINYAGIDLNTDDNKLKIQMAFAAATVRTRTTRTMCPFGNTIYLGR